MEYAALAIGLLHYTAGDLAYCWLCTVRASKGNMEPGLVFWKYHIHQSEDSYKGWAGLAQRWLTWQCERGLSAECLGDRVMLRALPRLLL
ncbi:hypothetical protein MATL_G00100760 [Megalops atlanticus]|uniref:Uncharacterized protein n=1 Tax=Megalops atlanticus TaxID=7932 RepID=A0A9D3Q4D5_MEGAT|nr:hypothetical protein MATL_G00100760 [Megalops atlanticus]